MASNDLIIDDDYCESMGAYLQRQGNRIDATIQSYINILNDVRSSALIAGETAEALDAYIYCAERLQNAAGDLSSVLNRQIRCFLTEVDKADQYLF